MKWSDITKVEQVSKPTSTKWSSIKKPTPPKKSKELSMRPPRGIAEIIINPFSKEGIKHIQTESMPAKLIENLFTSTEEYASRSSKSKDYFIKTVPMLRLMGDKLDQLEGSSGTGDMSPSDEALHGDLVEAYGSLYSVIEKSYDAGEFETGFDMKAVVAAFQDDFTGMLGHISNALLADPYILAVPVGWSAIAARSAKVAAAAGATGKTLKFAEVAGGVAGAGAMGAGFAAADSAATQLRDTGKVDIGQVSTAASMGAIAAPLLVGAAKGLTTGVKSGYSGYMSKTMQRQLKKAVIKIESKAQLYMSNGLKDPKHAIFRAMDDTFIPNAVRKQLALRHEGIRKINLTKEAIHARHERMLAEANTFKVRVGKLWGATKIHMANIFGDTSVELAIVSKRLSFAVNRMTMETAIKVEKALEIEAAINKVYKGLDSTDKLTFNLLWANGERSAISKLMTNSKKADPAAAESVFKYLDEVYDRSVDVGMKIGKVKQYLPRAHSDYDSFARSMGHSPSYVKTVLASAINKKFKLHNKEKVSKFITVEKAREFLSEDEIATALNKAFSTAKMTGGTRKAGHTLQRSIDKYDETTVMHLYDPMHTFSNYIVTMENRIAEAAFFGGKFDPNLTHATNVDNSIGRIASDLMKKGEIIEDDILRIDYLLKARFSMGTKAPIKFLSDARNILYTGILANPISALTQAGDLGNSAYVTSIRDTTVAMARVIARTNEIKMKDVGLDNIVREFEKFGTTARALDNMMGWSGFRAMDVLGKETTLNAVLIKYRRLANTKEGRKYIVDKYRDAFSAKEMTDVIKALQNKKTTNASKFIMWNELARVQPISLSQMAPAFLNHPNGRILYMLKSYSLRQINLMRRESIARMARGDVIGGTRALLRWSLILGTTNASVEHVKAWIRGDEVEFTDLLLATTYRNYGLSKHVLAEIRRGRPIPALMSMVLPPLTMVDTAWQDLINFGERFETLKYVPPYGKGLYYLLKDDG